MIGIPESEELCRSRRFIEKVTSAIPSGLFVYSATLRRNIFVNPPMAAIFGMETGEFAALGDPARRLVHPDDQELVADAVNRVVSRPDGETVSMEYRAWHKSGEWIWVRNRITIFEREEGGYGTLILGVVEDISERKQIESKLAYQATHDLLTGLPNRRPLFDRLEQETCIANHLGLQFTFALCDVDHFKQINDTHGHLTGDAVLSTLADVIRGEIRETDFAARLGGDEFCILFPQTATRLARQSIDRIRDRIQTHRLGPFPLTLSFGLVQWCAGMSIRDLFEKADQLLYQAKNSGRDCCSEFRAAS